MSETSPSIEVDVDSVFAVLSNERRRLILEHLLSRQYERILSTQSPVPVPELVDHLVSVELNGHEGPDELRDRIVLSLNHIHLPKLADSNLIEFDSDRGEVAIRETAIAVEPHLALVRDERPDWVDRSD